MNPQRIFLIGFMGSGKTTVGKMLEQHSNWKFVDMDKYIEKKYGMTIQSYFEKYSEEAFRKIEHECLKELLKEEKIIVATGGGTPCFFNNIEMINQYTTSFYLKLPPEKLALRLEISGIENRPLLQNKRGDDLVCFVKKKLNERKKYYEQAKICLEGTDEENFRKILKHIPE